MKKKILSAAIACTMIFSVICPVAMVTTVSAATLNVGVNFPAPPYGMPTITPPAGVHPRILMRSGDLNNIRQRWGNDQNSEAEETFSTWANTSINTSQNFPQACEDNWYNIEYLNIIQAKAFDYALNGTTANGNTAIAAMTNFLSKITYESGENVCRDAGWAVFVASEVYDWCYSLMNDSQRADYILKCEAILRKYMSIGYPPSNQKNLTGLGGESQLFRDILAFAIAIYDEKPSVYNYAMSRIEYKMAPGRKWFYESGAPYQGDMYGAYRYLCEIYAETLVRKMSGGAASIFTDDDHHGFETLPYHWMYMHRPDGRMFTRGDDNSGGWGITGYNTNHFYSNFLAGNLFGNIYFKGEAFRRSRDFDDHKYNDHHGLSAITWLALNDPTVNKTLSRTDLPKSVYFGSPAGEIVAKTSWTYGIRKDDAFLSNDAVSAYMRIGEYYGGNHDDLDSGSFQIYYKGILASASGFYDWYSSAHTKSYRKRTISHNALTISGNDDASQSERNAFFGSVSHTNDGGQKITVQEINELSVWQNENGRYKRATVIDHYVSDDYSYIKGDLTPAYASTKIDTTEPIVRNMAFVTTGNNNVPAFMIVYDRIKGKSNSNIPKFNLHTRTEPTISGNKTTVITDGGRLTVKTLLPEASTITKIGGEGHRFEVDGRNYEPIEFSSADESGWGRVEIRPTTVSGKTEFLNVLAVSNAGYSTDIPVTLIEGDVGVKGAKVLDQVVLFSKSKWRLQKSASFTVDSGTNLKFKILGIKPGYWKIKKDGSTFDVKRVTEDNTGNGATLEFTGNAGSYELICLGDSIEDQLRWSNKLTTNFENSSWEDYFTENESGLRTVPNDINYTNDTGDSLGITVKRIASRNQNTRTLQLKHTDSPLYSDNDSDFVRISFDIAKEAIDKPTHIRLVGLSEGETVATGTAVGDRFIFVKDDSFYYHDEYEEASGAMRRRGHSLDASTWYKVMVDVDCETDTYDVYINGELSESGMKLHQDFDKIYGISVTALNGGNSWDWTATYVDNIKFKTLLSGKD